MANEKQLVSNFSSSFTTGVTAPSTLTGLTATAGNAQVMLNWSASSGATSYDIYRSTSSVGEGSTPYQTGVTGTSFTDSSLTNGTTYYYEVSAVNAIGHSPVSSQVSATPQAAGSLVLALSAGGPASGSFVADTDYSGGGTYSNSDTVPAKGRSALSVLPSSIQRRSVPVTPVRSSYNG